LPVHSAGKSKAPKMIVTYTTVRGTDTTVALTLSKARQLAKLGLIESEELWGDTYGEDPQNDLSEFYHYDDSVKAVLKVKRDANKALKAKKAQIVVDEIAPSDGMSNR
jgi:hypothetical protein